MESKRRSVEFAEAAIKSKQGHTLRYCEWRPDRENGPPRAMILIVHGFGEHGERYDRLARRLAQAGYMVGCGDLRGMGQSEGVRGFASDYEEYVTDTETFVAKLKANDRRETPLFIYGHSMGGLVALRHAQTRPEAGIASTILSGPLLGVAVPVPAWQVAFGRVMVRIAPGMPMPVPFDATVLTHDEERIAMLKSDALNITQIRLAWFFASERAMAETLRDVSKIAWPTLWLIAGDDRICASSAARVVYDRLPNPETHRWIDFPGLFHELHQERSDDFERLAGHVCRWVEDHLE